MYIPTASLLLVTLALQGAEPPLSTSINPFSVAVYQKVASARPEGNLVFAPASLHAGLSMAYLGAKTDTAQGIATTLHCGPLSKTILASQYEAWFSQTLVKEGPYVIHTCHGIWPCKEGGLNPQYLNTIQQQFGATGECLDYRHAPEAALAAINAKIAEMSQGAFPSLLPPEAITSLTRLTLANVMTFKSAWATPFDPKATDSEGAFTLADGQRIQCPTMHTNGQFPYYAATQWEWLEIPYQNHALSFCVLLPTVGLSLSHVEQILTHNDLTTCQQAAKKQSAWITLPRFAFQSQCLMKESLSALGMGQAFTTEADFSDISANGPLYLWNVIHQTNIMVDETGTQASAATALPLSGYGDPLPPDTIPFACNRPFLFFIRHNASQVILFAGRVANPLQ